MVKEAALIPSFVLIAAVLVLIMLMWSSVTSCCPNPPIIKKRQQIGFNTSQIDTKKYSYVTKEKKLKIKRKDGFTYLKEGIKIQKLFDFVGLYRFLPQKNISDLIISDRRINFNYNQFTMKFSLPLLAMLGSSLLQSAFSLDKTQDQAAKFLLDQGQITDKAVVQSFYLDRNGRVRINFLEDGNVLSFGLQEEGDTYNVDYMSKKKDRRPKKKTAEEENTNLETLIGENYAMLKGGKVKSVTKSTQNKKKVDIEYTHGGKEYKINAYYNEGKGELSVSKVEEVVKEKEL